MPLPKEGVLLGGCGYLFCNLFEIWDIFGGKVDFCLLSSELGILKKSF